MQRHRRNRQLSQIALTTSIVLLASLASAQISGITLDKREPVNLDTGTIDRFSSLALVSSSGTAFQARLSGVTLADGPVGVFSFDSQQNRWSVEFTVSLPAYQLTINTRYVGCASLVDDAQLFDDQTGSASPGATTGSVELGPGLTTGTLSLSDPSDLPGTVPGDSCFNVSSSATIVRASAAPTTHRFAFSSINSVVSDAWEAAVKFGMAATQAGQTAGTNNGTSATNGYFVDVSVVPLATPTPSRTATPTVTRTATPTVTRTATRTATPTGTATRTPTPTVTASATITPVSTVTATPTALPTATETVTPTQTAPPSTTPTPLPTVTPCVPVTLLNEGFEDNTLGSFTTVTIGDALGWFAAINPPPHSGSFYALSNSPEAVAQQNLTLTSAIPIPADADAVTLTFWHRFEFENPVESFDGGVLETSIDDGDTWQDAGALITTGGYNGVLSETANPLAGRNAWVASTEDFPNQFQAVSVDFSSFAGQSLRFRFRHGTDATVAYTGWGIDDVALEIEQGCATPTPVASATVTPTVTPVPTETVTAVATATANPTPIATTTAIATTTPVITATPVVTATAIATATAVNTATPTVTATAIATNTATPTTTATPADTATPTVTATPSVTATAASTATPTVTATTTATATPDESPSPTGSATPSGTPVPTDTATATSSGTVSPTPTVVATFTVVATATPSPASTAAPGPLDHFLCYDIHRPPLGMAGVATSDQFVPNGTVTVRQAKRLCTPVNKNDEDPSAPDHPGHETAYTIRQTSPRFDHARDIPVTVANDFGSEPPTFPTFTVDLVRAERLLVPTSKSLAGPDFPPALAVSLDHFKCYRVRGARFRRASIAVETQFGSLSVAIKRPRTLCVPADKNGEGIFDETRGLMCFDVRATPQPPRRVFTTNQFEQAAYDIFGVRDLCVPAFVNPGTCGDDTVNAPGEQCDGADAALCAGPCLPDCTCSE